MYRDGLWSESTIPGTLAWYVATTAASWHGNPTAAAWRELDVTAHVRSELSASRRIVNLALHAGGATVEKMVVASREAAANRPELVLTP